MCLNINICKCLISNISNLYPLQVVGYSSETQLQVNENLPKINQQVKIIDGLIMISLL